MKAFHLLHQAGASQNFGRSLVPYPPVILGPWLTQRKKQRMQVRGLSVPEEQVPDPLREDKGEVGGPEAPPCLAGEVLPST